MSTPLACPSYPPSMVGNDPIICCDCPHALALNSMSATPSVKIVLRCFIQTPFWNRSVWVGCFMYFRITAISCCCPLTLSSGGPQNTSSPSPITQVLFNDQPTKAGAHVAEGPATGKWNHASRRSAREKATAKKSIGNEQKHRPPPGKHPPRGPGHTTSYRGSTSCKSQ